MANVRAFEIPHPDFALITPKGRTLIISRNNSKAADILDVSLIARIEVAEHA